MKSAIIKIASSFLAFVVLLSTVSFTVEKHFCGGELASVSFFANADKCEMESLEKSENSVCHEVSKKSCCEDEISKLKATNTDTQCNHENIKLPKLDFVAPFLYTFVFNFEEKRIEIIPNKKQESPPLTKDRPVLFQTFLL
ncbi:HYC_CC_PP family protein [Aureivirga sp. CE67]|uniref:HYC_CC_PP family protein n=1 Tax=Aureivirga sp. CE67 TaxID=1788983 RepID=UPI0018CB122A|nr:hypothetical protein [Aureivirga sp. CE67]